MATSSGNQTLSNVEIVKLKQFHAAHFPNQEIPEIGGWKALGATKVSHDDLVDDDGLGYYHDGVKRTLTDEQIKMFRHSEIQRLSSARKREAELIEESAGTMKQGHEERRTVGEEHNSPRDTTGTEMRRGGRRAHFDDPMHSRTAENFLDYGE